MSEPPGEVDERACRILIDAVSSPDGRLELNEKHQSHFERYQAEFYYLLEKTEEDLPLIEPITGILDRIALFVPMVLAKALGLPISGKNANSAPAVWRSINERIEIDLIDLHIRPLQEISNEIYRRYHKFSKPQLDEVIERITHDLAKEDFHRLGEEFQKLFNSKDLFLSLEDFQNLEFKEEPQLFSDEQISITERIQRFELYRDVLKRDVGDLDLNTIIEIAEAYWQRGDEKQEDYNSCQNLLRYAIKRAEDQNIGGDLVRGLEKLGEKYLIIGKVSEAEESFSKALTEGRKFGNDNTVAYLLTKLADSRISNPDSDISAAQIELAEAEEIWLLFGHKKNLLSTIAVKVKLHIARSEYDAAKEEIRRGMNLYEEGFHPRSRWEFMDRCSRYLLDCPDKDMNSRGLELLDEAIALADYHGEFSKLIVSLRNKEYHAEDLALATARSQLARYSKLQENLDIVIVKFAKAYQGGTKEIEEFVGELLGAKYREGLRRASSLVPIEQVEGMEPKYFESFEGEYGRYKSLDRQQRPLRREGDYTGAIEMLEELEKLATKFDSNFFKTKNLEHRFHCVRIDAATSKHDRKKKQNYKKDLISKLITQWTSLNSSVGIMNWKNQLALLLQREAIKMSNESDPQAIKLMEEIEGFYRDKDARRYAYSRFNSIKWTHGDKSVDSIAEYEALTKDPALSGDPRVKLELFRREANHLHSIGRLRSAIEVLSKANELAVGRHEAQETTPFHDVIYLAREVEWHIENNDDVAAEDKRSIFKRIAGRDWGNYAVRLNMEFKASIERMRGNNAEAKVLYRNAIEHALKAQDPLSNKTHRMNEVSALFYRLWEIHIELEELDAAEKVLMEKIYFDASNDLSANLHFNIQKNIEVIRKINSAEEAKEFLIRLCDDDRIPQTSPSWILSQLHIELKEWDDAEKVLKKHLILISELGDMHLLNPTIKRLIDCCQKNNGTEHTIEVLRELADHSDYSIASSSLHALINFHRERGESEIEKELLGAKIDFEIENENSMIASINSRRLAHLHMKLGEHEDAIKVLKEECERLEEFKFVNGALIEIGKIHRKMGEFDELKDTLLKRIRGAEKAQSYRSYWTTYDYLINLHIELEELEDAKRVLREAIAIEDRSPKGRSQHLRMLYGVHIKLGEWDDAVKVTKQRINLNLEFGDNRSAWFAPTVLFNDAIEHERFAVAQEAMQARIPIQFSREDSDEEEIKSAIEEFVGLDADQLDSKIQELMLEIPKQINKRDEWNSKVRKYLDERNEFNRQVKELIKEVQAQKAIRNKANQKVKEHKDVRAERSTHLKEARRALRANKEFIKEEIVKLEKKRESDGFSGEQKERKYHKVKKKLLKALKEATKSRADGGMRELKDSVREAERNQEDAHKTVEEAVKKAQEDHNLMVNLSMEVDSLREKANAAHITLTKSKKEADSSHSQSISLKYRIEGAIRLKMGAINF